MIFDLISRLGGVRKIISMKAEWDGLRRKGPRAIEILTLLGLGLIGLGALGSK